MGSSQRDDICQLITEHDIRSVFKLDDQVEIKQKEKHSATCTHEWDSPNGENYSIPLASIFQEEIDEQ